MMSLDDAKTVPIPDPDPLRPTPDPQELTADDLVAEALAVEAQRRLWLRAIVPLLQLRSHDSDPSGRVQLAYDLMHIAACERASRLLQSDPPAEDDERHII
jgi:hypothetical protein